MSSIIYFFDPITGRFFGSSHASENPDVAGTFIVPPTATLTPPPNLIDGHEPLWRDGAWVQTPYPTPEQPTQEMLDAAKIAALEKIAKDLLLQSDFSVLPDVELTNKADWLSYRAVLRDIAKAPTLDKVIPPTPPKLWA